jgi:hypothetical protein
MHPIEKKWQPYQEGMGTLNRFGRRLESARTTLKDYGITSLTWYWEAAREESPRAHWERFIVSLESEVKRLKGANSFQLAL